MRLRMVLGLALLAVEGCARDGRFEERPLAAEAMPASFAYGSLARGRADYRQALDPASGENVKRATIDGQGEWAIVEVRALPGGRVYATADPKALARPMLRADLDVAWGDGGEVRGGAGPVTWRRFLVAAPPGSCVALGRTLRARAGAGAAAGGSAQELAAAVYCRAGREPLPAAEIPKIAAALTARG